MRRLLCLFLLSVGLSSYQPAAAQTDLKTPARVMLGTGHSTTNLRLLRRNCNEPRCHAIIFVHGIYGSEKSFADWPQYVSDRYKSEGVDVYVLEYQTSLFGWARTRSTSLDLVVEDVFDAIAPLIAPAYSATPRYLSVNFIAHSLGGNVVAAYLHTVKSILGHEARARHGFVITLGTPVLGAEIADVAAKLREAMNEKDPLLESLRSDNTFLRMMRYWVILEETKAEAFHCRRVQRFAAIEGSSVWGVRVVPKDSANGLARILAERKVFDDYDHMQLAAPAANRTAVRDWADTIIADELLRLNSDSNEKLCFAVL